MSRLLLCVLVLVLCSTRAFAQVAWTHQFPIPKVYPITAVAFSDIDRGLGVGPLGSILRTTDGGATWTPQVSGTTRDLRKNTMQGAYVAAVLGDSGTLLFTDDAGTTWRQDIVPLGLDPTDVEFIGGNVVVVGYHSTRKSGVILRSTDAGVTWTEQYALPGVSFTALDFSSKGACIAVGTYGYVVRSSDAGLTWSATRVDTTEDFKEVTFADDATVFVGGMFTLDYGQLLRSTDSGATWSTMRVDSGSSRIYSIGTLAFADVSSGAATDAQFGLALSEYHEAVLRTNNGGRSWTHLDLMHDHRYLSVFIIDSLTAVIVERGGRLLRTTDGGRTWNQHAKGFKLNLNGVAFTDTLHGVVVGDSGTILRTTNGGRDWAREQGVNNNSSLRAVTSKGSSDEVIVGENIIQQRVSTSPVWLATWEPSSLERRTVWHDVTFLNASFGVARGGPPPDDFQQWSPNRLALTTNGGASWQSWQLVTQLSGSEFRKVHFFDEQRAIAIVNNGWAASTDGGYTWRYKPRNVPGEFDERRFVCLDEQTWVVIGFNGRVARTTDGGVTWDTLFTGTSQHLNAIDFFDANNGVIVGNLGTILRTSDGGVTWLLDSSGTNLNLYGVDVTSRTSATAVGLLGTILHATFPDTQTSVADDNNARPSHNTSTSAASNMTIHPNPTDASCTISFGKGLSQITIYNDLGDVVYTCAVNDAQRSISVPTAHLASGVYYCRSSHAVASQTTRLVVLH